MAKKTIEEKEAQWEQEKDVLERERRIKSEKKSYKKKRFTTSKIVMLFLFINCSLIELFTCWATVQSIDMAYMFGGYVDFSPLITLIGTVVGEVVGFAVYALKAKAENTQGGITYLETQHEYEIEDEERHAQEDHTYEGGVG